MMFGKKMIDRVRRIADATHAEVVALRRDIHQHPELATEEHRTSERVAAALESLGCDVHGGFPGTGVVAIFGGARPGPSLLLRPTWMHCRFSRPPACRSARMCPA